MSFKLKHHPQPVTTNVHTLWEVVVIEFAIGLICAGMAFWAKEIVIQLFIGCAAVAGICFLLTLHNIVLIVKINRQNKKLQEEKLRDERQSGFDKD